MNLWWLAILCMGVGILLLTIIIILNRYLSDEWIVRQLGSSRFRLIAIIGVSSMVAIVSFLDWAILQQNKERARKSIGRELSIVLTSAAERLDSLVEQRKTFLLRHSYFNWAGIPNLQKSPNAC